MFQKSIEIITDAISKMDAGDWIAVVACIISVIAASISVIQYKLSEKEYELLRKEAEDREPQISLAIKDAKLIKKIDDQKVVYKINICISNISDRATSIRGMWINWESRDKQKYKFPSNMSSEFSVGNNIAPHNSEKGEVCFEVPLDIYAKVEIEKTFIRIEDIHDYVVDEKIIYIKECGCNEI